MKRLLFASTLFLAGLVGAATTTWKPTDAATGTIATHSIKNVDFAKDVKITLDYTVSADFSIENGNPKGNLLVAKWNGAASNNPNGDPGLNYVVFRQVANSPRVVLNGNDGQAYNNTTNATDGFAEGEHTLVITFNLANKTASISIDGGDFVSIDYTSSETGNAFDVTYGDTLDLAATDRDNFTYNDITIEYTDSSIPEPTALALLALGVAGLALRRRAA